MRAKLRPLLTLALLLALSACGVSSGAQRPGATARPTEPPPLPRTEVMPVRPTEPPPLPRTEVMPVGSGSARRSQLGEPFSIRVGETIFVDLPDLPGTPALAIRFESVLSDSRCPRMVQCVVAGDATLAVVAEIAGRTPETLELHTSPTQHPIPLAYATYAVQLAALEPLPDRPEDVLRPGDYRAQLVVTSGSASAPTPGAAQPTAPPRLTIDACSLVAASSFAEQFGPLRGTPQPGPTANGDGQQCVLVAERASVTLTLYRGDANRARALVEQLRQGGAPLAEATDSPVVLEVFGQDRQQAVMVQQFGGAILIIQASFAAQAQPADRSQAHERLSTLGSMALTRYAAGDTRQLATPTRAP